MFFCATTDVKNCDSKTNSHDDDFHVPSQFIHPRQIESYFQSNGILIVFWCHVELNWKFLGNDENTTKDVYFLAYREVFFRLLNEVGSLYLVASFSHCCALIVSNVKLLIAPLKLLTVNPMNLTSWICSYIWVGGFKDAYPMKLYCGCNLAPTWDLEIFDFPRYSSMWRKMAITRDWSFKFFKWLLVCFIAVDLNSCYQLQMGFDATNLL